MQINETAHPVLLDTCAAIWLMNGAHLSPASRDAIRGAQLSNQGVYVSPITAWEIATLVREEQAPAYACTCPMVRSDAGPSRRSTCRYVAPIADASTELSGTSPNDPADRIIAATGRAFGYVIVTRDGELIPYAGAGHVQAIAC